MTDLTITPRCTDAATVLELAGDLDFDSAPCLLAALRDLPLPAHHLLVIGLCALTFCDSSGITALLSAQRRAQSAGAGFALSAVPARVTQIFAITGLEGIFVTHATTDQALATPTPS